MNKTTNENYNAPSENINNANYANNVNYLQMKRLFTLLILATSLALHAQDTIRLLCIGNSFSWDAVEQELSPLCTAAKQPIVIGNLYYGGCSLQQHYNFLQADTAAYSFRYIKDGIRTVTEPYSLREALRLQQWDYISLQQASGDSGIDSTFEPYLTALIDTVRKYQPTAHLCWMMTWAYAADSNHPHFPRYNSNQTTMNEAILTCVQNVLNHHPELILVPCGTAVQNARHYLGDVLCRDGYHLNLTYGRYTAACTWLEVLTGKSVIGNPYRNAAMTPKQQRKTQRAAHKAVKHWDTL